MTKMVEILVKAKTLLAAMQANVSIGDKESTNTKGLIEVSGIISSLIASIESLQSKMEIDAGFAKVVLAERNLAWYQLETLQKENKRWNSLRPCVQRAAEHMELTLQKNDFKGGWSDISFRELYSRLREETHEIWIEYSRADPDWKGILRETPDVANYAMMIAELALSHLQEGKSL